MPKFTSVFEETSPIFQYSSSPSWEPGDSSTESNANRYSAASWNANRSQNATVSFQYFGGEVVVYGSKRVDHGQLQLSVDNEPKFVGSTNVANETDDIFQQMIARALVENGPHSATLMNLEDKWLDVDFFSWDTEIGESDEELIVNTIQDSSSLWEYRPSAAWGEPSDRMGMFAGSSGHGTTSAGATAELQFSGDCIAVYGPVGPRGSSYTVQINSDPARGFNAHYPRYYTKQVLFWAGGLGPGNHTLKITKDALSDSELAIDYAEVYTTPSLGGVDLVASAGDFSTVASRASGGKSSTPLLAALGAVSGLALISLVMHVIIFFRHRRARKALASIDIDIASTVRSRRGSSTALSPFLVHNNDSIASRQAQPSSSHTYQKPPTGLELRPEHLESPPAYTNSAGSSTGTKRS